MKCSLIPFSTYNLSITKPRFYSNLIDNYEIEDKIKNLKPIKVYNSLKIDRVQILKENKDKSGV
jgi:aspartate carbamoyltransferase regulatory subunit